MVRKVKEVKEPLFCITARNRLTGEREIISRPMTRKEAEDMKVRLAYRMSGKKPYTHCKVDPYIPQKDLFDNK